MKSLTAIGLVIWLGLSAVVRAAEADPWATYNRGISAYAAADFAAAERIWQELAYTRLPRGLRQPVWFQVGNAQFRLGEKAEAGTPEQAVEYWRQSAQAFRQVLLLGRGHQAATHNLALVEARLARLANRLGTELTAQAARQPLDESINSLHAAEEYLREATDLAPRDEQFRKDHEVARMQLQSRLLERAGDFEKRGDVSAGQNYRDADLRAEREYRSAVADLNDAAFSDRAEASRPQDPGSQRSQNEAVDSARARVTEKLSQLLTRMGQRELKSGEQQADFEPDAAIGHFEQALEDFREAQAEKPDNAAAQVGEARTRTAMERLLMQEARLALKAGKEALGMDIPTAARELSSALSQFSGAMEMNPFNAEAKAGAEEARRLLPEALSQLGQREQRAGERVEGRSPGEAIPHFQDAESAYERSLQMAPEQPQAQAGLEQVRQKLERARQQLAQEISKEQGQLAQGKPQTLEQLLGQLQDRERDPRQELQRERQKGRNEPAPRRGYPDW